MTISGSKDFELDVAEYVEEAFERCGLEVRTGYDLKTESVRSTCCWQIGLTAV